VHHVQCKLLTTCPQCSAVLDYGHGIKEAGITMAVFTKQSYQLVLSWLDLLAMQCPSHFRDFM